MKKRKSRRSFFQTTPYRILFRSLSLFYLYSFPVLNFFRSIPKLAMTTTYRVCFCFSRKFVPASNEPPEEIKNVFRRYSDNGLMGPEQLQQFLIQVQGDADATKESAQSVIDGQREFKHLNMMFQKKGFNLDAFFRFLSGDANPPLDPSQRVHQDMRAPLAHYFIYTGHNSYLTGNQISSDSSDVPIIKALQRGVRVIELDLWPNSARSDVEVRHGRTLTTPVELIKCLRSIRDHAFTASPYPVVITLEDHLTADLQAKVAEMIHETFEDLLFYPNSEILEEFPSPEDLKMRIIISTKPPKEFLESKTVKDKDNELPKDAEDEQWGAEVTDLKSEISAENNIEIYTEKHSGDEEDFDDVHQMPHHPVAPEYRRLIAISAIKGKGELSDSLQVDPHRVSRLSLSEQLLKKAAHFHGTQLIRFTRRNILRVYPKGTRVTSSNYNPLHGWMYGAQMVALNMQGYGRSLWIMHGMFRANGGCGYVKKPDILLHKRKNNQEFDPKAIMPVKKILKVRVYMGDGWRFDFSQRHFDKYSPPDFYTRVGIAGVPADTVMKRTRAIEDNWTPFWNEEFIFQLTVPELALLRIEVHEYDMNERDDFGGQTCLPVWELRSGIRAVPLHDRKGNKLKSCKLLMRFEFTEFLTV